MSQLELPLVENASASEPVRETLEKVAKKYGFVPNVYRVFAHSPAALNSYLAISEQFQTGTLTATERNVVLLAAAVENECRYCVAVHSTVADMQKDAPQITEAVRTGAAIDDHKLEAVRSLAQALVRGRGHAGDKVRAFIDAGYQPAQVLEVLVGITLKILSNYTNHLCEIPLDDAFKNRAWEPTASS